MQEQLAHLSKAVAALTDFNQKLMAKLNTFTAPVVAEAKVDFSALEASMKDAHLKIDRIGEMLFDHVTKGDKIQVDQDDIEDLIKKPAKTK